MELILTDHLRSHMACHDNEFLEGWEKTFEQLRLEGTFDYLKGDVERIVTTFDTPIGYSMLLETTDDDEIIYAKRLERNLYTRFIKGKEPGYSYQVMCILKKSQQVNDAYELITMYPGGNSEKEPEDLHIQDKEEMKRSLLFWRNRALIYIKENIEPGSEKDYCPYQNLFYILEDS